MSDQLNRPFRRKDTSCSQANDQTNLAIDGSSQRPAAEPPRRGGDGAWIGAPNKPLKLFVRPMGPTTYGTGSVHQCCADE